MTEFSTQVWTDGACSGGRGGWAWCTADGRSDSGAADNTTNQRMELQAAIQALVDLPGSLQIHSDSAYVVNCFLDGWWRKWVAQDWVTSQRKAVANRDLWETLIGLVASSESTFVKVSGHSGDPMNDRADELAVAAREARAPKLEEPDVGHTFHLSFQSRLAMGNLETSVVTDADWWGPTGSADVRAWDLPAALVKAARLPLERWQFDALSEPPRALSTALLREGMHLCMNGEGAETWSSWSMKVDDYLRRLLCGERGFHTPGEPVCPDCLSVDA